MITWGWLSVEFKLIFVACFWFYWYLVRFSNRKLQVGLIRDAKFIWWEQWDVAKTSYGEWWILVLSPLDFREIIWMTSLIQLQSCTIHYNRQTTPLWRFRWHEFALLVATSFAYVVPILLITNLNAELSCWGYTNKISWSRWHKWSTEAGGLAAVYCCYFLFPF